MGVLHDTHIHTHGAVPGGDTPKWFRFFSNLKLMVSLAIYPCHHPLQLDRTNGT